MLKLLNKLWRRPIKSMKQEEGRKILNNFGISLIFATYIHALICFSHWDCGTSVVEEDIMVIEFSERGRIETDGYNYLRSLKLRSDFFFANMSKDLQEG
ncbi:hypothetical protein Syun_011033 [Stephania yunnanensis]|uniref:Transmembrane protein n=1 Tax=Stephania yunnanensis TaxID=152371 RepID=A0AAP0JY29_9MAGN